MIYIVICFFFVGCDAFVLGFFWGGVGGGRGVVLGDALGFSLVCFLGGGGVCGGGVFRGGVGGGRGMVWWYVLGFSKGWE